MANSAIDAIFGVTQDARIRMAMVMGGLLESGLNPNAVGDNGKSFGIFQIYTVAHPNVSPAQAKDPQFAAKYMLPAYTSGVAKVPDAVWQANPAKAAATAAYYAERPKNMYPDSRVTANWPKVQAALSGQDVSTGGGTGGGVVTAGNPFDPIGDSIDNAVDSFRRGVMVLANMALFFAATLVGGVFVAIGLIMLFRDASASSAYGSVKSGVGSVGGAPIKAGRALARYVVGPKGERGYDNGGNQA